MRKFLGKKWEEEDDTVVGGWIGDFRFLITGNRDLRMKGRREHVGVLREWNEGKVKRGVDCGWVVRIVMIHQ